MKCQKCGAAENLLVNSRSVSKDGQRVDHLMCRSCKAEHLRKYRQTKTGKEQLRMERKAYFKRNKEKVDAWKQVRKIKKEPCQVCGKFPVHGHHPDYGKPWDVIFLCPLHHKQEHTRLTKLNVDKLDIP